ncbi:DUF1993 domain-containing protein [Methylocella sp.]|uniref:DUF1993 domain-containing protein n=1 Tax=Methylocella sp. TaxID=1978226 RepID=UPI003C1AC5C7
MPLSMYDVTVPAFLRAFANLSAILAKAEAHAKATGLDPNVYLQARLASDMLPLTGQIQRAGDTAKGCVVRLGAVENVSFPDTEANFAELDARIAKTADLLRGASASRLNDAEHRKVEMKFRDRTVTFDGRDYVAFYALPNFYFHVTTAYDLLRHKGLEIGKADFIGAFDRPETSAGP